MTADATLRRLGLVAGALWVLPAAAQVDQERAAQYFAEAAALCEREAGRLWGVSLCGPMVFADAATSTIATNQPAPSAPRPVILGFANAAMDWGGTRWATFVWPMLAAAAPPDRARLMLHELFHRIQPQLGLFVADRPNDHLETADGRYWLQLEWRALASALASRGAERTGAVSEALAFRARRRSLFPDAAERERLLEVQEGLAQYTGTVAAAADTAEAIASAIEQLTKAPQYETFLRTFAYPSGAAYGILLDAWSPGWTRRIKATDDLGAMLAAAANVVPTSNVDSAAGRYDGPVLRIAEEQRAERHKLRVAELRRRFVEGPVLVMPRAPVASFVSSGITQIPGAGTVVPTYRATGPWGRLEATSVLVAPDQSTLTVPAGGLTRGKTITGDGWTLELAPGWELRAGARAGDYQVVRDTGPSRPND
jgi:hypothetical protein